MTFRSPPPRQSVVFQVIGVLWRVQVCDGSDAAPLLLQIKPSAPESDRVILNKQQALSHPAYRQYTHRKRGLNSF